MIEVAIDEIKAPMVSSNDVVTKISLSIYTGRNSRVRILSIGLQYAYRLYSAMMYAWLIHNRNV